MRWPNPGARLDFLDAAVVPTWPKVMARLREDNETAAVKLKIESSLDCLRQFVPVDNGPRPILPKGAAMVFAGGQPGNLVFGNCGHKFSGGLLAAGFDHYVTYDSTVTDGAMRLSGGEVCEINMGRF
jgi:hypothetical protein